MFIKHDGRAALCPTMTEAEGAEFEQASLDGATLQSVWRSHPTFTRFRGVQCRNVDHCPSGDACRGGCRSNAYLLHGSVDSPDEVSCNLHKNGGDEYRNFLGEYDAHRRVSLRVVS
jgi:radical SAM protein with 4Fe4S-binding SPASM domain